MSQEHPVTDSKNRVLRVIVMISSVLAALVGLLFFLQTALFLARDNVGGLIGSANQFVLAMAGLGMAGLLLVFAMQSKARRLPLAAAGAVTFIFCLAILFALFPTHADPSQLVSVPGVPILLISEAVIVLAAYAFLRAGLFQD